MRILSEYTDVRVVMNSVFLSLACGYLYIMHTKYKNACLKENKFFTCF